MSTQLLMRIKTKTPMRCQTSKMFAGKWLEQRHGVHQTSKERALMDLNTPAKRWRSCVGTANGKFVSSYAHTAAASSAAKGHHKAAEGRGVVADTSRQR